MKLMRIVLSAALVAVVATSAFAFMAHNSVDASMAGEGSGTVYGYHVTNIHYVISPTDPSIVDGASFTLDAPAKTVFVKLDNGWVDHCAQVDHTNNWACVALPWNIKLEDLKEFEVMAAQ